MDARLLKNDLKLLNAALASNGGGTADWKHPLAAQVRMLKAGFVQLKSRHTGMLTITQAGRERLKVAKDGPAPLARCAADRDGDCTHPQCPQLRDGEPAKSGRHCPIDTILEGNA